MPASQYLVFYGLGFTGRSRRYHLRDTLDDETFFVLNRGVFVLLLQNALI